jgi:hypothetical protein
VDEHDRADSATAPAGNGPDDLRGEVIAVIDEDDLGRDTGDGGGKAAQELLDVACLVVGRHQDRELGGCLGDGSVTRVWLAAHGDSGVLEHEILRRYGSGAGRSGQGDVASP